MKAKFHHLHQSVVERVAGVSSPKIEHILNHAMNRLENAAKNDTIELELLNGTVLIIKVKKKAGG